MLIDFQWSTSINQEVPSKWPHFIGSHYKHPAKFDDSYSLYKSINTIISSK